MLAITMSALLEGRCAAPQQEQPWSRVEGSRIGACAGEQQTEELDLMAAELKSDAKTEAKRGIALVDAVATQAAAQAEAQIGAQMKSQAEPARKMMEDGAAKARETMEQGMQQATKTAEGFYKAAEQAAEFSRGNLEAMTKATQTLTTGMQDLGRQYFAMSQAITDHAMESAKALSGVKSLKEAADIQAAFAKASLERTMAETAKLQEAAYRLAEQASAPLTARMTLAAEKFGKPLAA
ncbi:phasin family protein [Falsiroseomonas sp. HC035]|uniref:phasin family protein n=1 Tax=Falsiroseomonas sp. HC035 TaxID=3390999 RepID=UPI003D321DD3